MTEFTIAWIALSFFVGFIIYLVPKLSRALALGIAIASLIYSGFLFLEPSPIQIQVLDIAVRNDS